MVNKNSEICSYIFSSVHASLHACVQMNSLKNGKNVKDPVFVFSFISLALIKLVCKNCFILYLGTRPGPFVVNICMLICKERLYR